ncbi:MAG: sigma-54-dependent Fis family transcriptional regulator, partial [Bdellovibrionales bacterium]|nr:sigma-54-dependent Fis family transcriptional regulator [Bdellovibrionales bacterium]
MSKSLRLLVIDDDSLVADAIRLLLPNHWTLTYHGESKNIPPGFFHAALVDMHLTEKLEAIEGTDVIRQLKNRDPHLSIVAMSGDINRQTMELCLKVGASRFLAKPLHPDEVLLCLEKIEASLLLRGALGRRPDYEVQWLGQSQPARKVLDSVAQLKGEDGPILISGATGTGKEVVARLLHFQEGPDRPFVSINAAALPEQVFESEFFGHVKGAFTGADHHKMGLAEAAAGGDLFIDELEALPLSLQPKLLRFLQEGEIRRVGSSQFIRVNARIIAATNESLPELTKKGQFREDLMWRVMGKNIHLPTLRERSGDIQILAEYFLNMKKNQKKSLSIDAIEELNRYDWPGNVRELKRVCEQLLLIAPLPLIRGEDVRATLPGRRNQNSSSVGTPLELVQLSTMLNQFEQSVLEKAINEYDDLDDL